MLPHQAPEYVHHIALDIGGSLIKLVYFSPDPADEGNDAAASGGALREGGSGSGAGGLASGSGAASSTGSLSSAGGANGRGGEGGGSWGVAERAAAA